MAVNILRDAEYQVCVRPFRLRSGQELPMGGLNHRAAHADLDGGEYGLRKPAEELAKVFASALAAGVPAADIDLLRRLYTRDQTVAEVARSFDVSPRTILNRRLVAIARIRRVAA